MKKILLCGALLCCTGTMLRAQGVSLRLNQLNMNTLSVKPNITGLTFNGDLQTKSLSLDLVGSFAAFQGKSKLLRLGIGYSSLTLKGRINTSNSDQTYDRVDAIIKQNTTRVAPGISTALAGSDRFGLYTGIDLPVSVIGSTTFEANSENRLRDPNDSLVTESSRFEGKIAGGFSIGLSPFLGFSYGAGPLSIGTEIATGLQYMMSGPDAEVKYYEDGRFVESGTTDIDATSFSKIPVRVSIVLTYRFGKPSAE
jgi:hypothetical protein